MPQFVLEYGKVGHPVTIDDRNLVRELRQRPVRALENAAAEIMRALRQPLGTAPLRDLAFGRRNACVVVCDITRPVPSGLILEPMLEELAAVGISPEAVTVLIATGTHRPNDEAELEKMLGSSVLAKCRVVNHVCTESDAMVDLGTSPNGVPIKLNHHYIEAELKLTIGMVEPHFMAGFAGGRKMVMPGIAALETVQAWHSPRFLEHPNATNGVVAGNPVHEEALAIAKLARPDFIVDVALTADKRPAAVAAGDMEQAWEKMVTFVRESVTAELDEPVDIVVTSGGGYPLDLTYYQTVKGMVGALPVLKPGGSIVIASACEEGVGNRHFLDCLLDLETIEDFPDRIQRPDWTFVPDQWQVEELAKAVRGRTAYHVASGIDPAVHQRLFVQPVLSADEGLAAALERHGTSARVAVIPKGPYVLPALRD